MDSQHFKLRDDLYIQQFNRMMSQENYKNLPFNPILHKYPKHNYESASKEADKKISLKSRRRLNIKIGEYNPPEPDKRGISAAIQYLTSKEIKIKNSESAYNPIKLDSKLLSLPSSHKKRFPGMSSQLLILNQGEEDANALQEYNREVSKRVRVLKNNHNKYLVRYEFDKRIKDLEDNIRDKIESRYK